MANAKKRGDKYRVLVYVGTENGKRKYKSFTAATKKQAEYMADAYRLRQKRELANITVADAVGRYIELKRPVLSPSTLREYVRLRDNAFDLIGKTLADNMTSARVQHWVSEYARTHSPKSTQNAKGLLLSALRMFCPDKSFSVTMPQAERKRRAVPTDADVAALLRFFRGGPMEAAIYLAAFGTMRRGEICALTWDDVSGDVVHVARALVRDENGQTVSKAPKTTRGDRFITMPPGVLDRIREICPESPIVGMPLNEVTKQFGRAVRRLNLPPIRFHDLRHYSAAVMHFLGVPEHYAMNRGGWENKQTMTQIYEDILSDKTDAITETINGYFAGVFEKVQP